MNYADLRSLLIHTDIKKTLTPWSSVSMAVIRTPFSLALSTCIWGQSLVLRIKRRLPWVLITGRILKRNTNNSNELQTTTLFHGTKEIKWLPLVSMQSITKTATDPLFTLSLTFIPLPLDTFNQLSKVELSNLNEQKQVVGLPRRDCSVPSSVDAMSLSLSNPRPLSIHD